MENASEVLALAKQAQAAGDLAAAEQHYRRVIELEPANAVHRHQLAGIYWQQKRPDEAVLAARKAVELAPNVPQMYDILGASLEQAGRLDEAIECFRTSAALAPSLGAVYNLATLLVRQQRNGEAIEQFLRAASIAPVNYQVHNNLGVALMKDGQFAEAVASFRRAVQLQPGFYEAQCSVGKALTRLGDFATAERELRTAIAMAPKKYEAHNSLGNLLQQVGRLDEAMHEFNSAIACQKVPAPHYNRALLRLLLGDFASGWSEFEWRWKMPNAQRTITEIPPWEGESLDSRTLLVVHEQGLGDTIQTIRFAADIKRHSPQARVLFRCPKQWHALLRSVPDVNALVCDEPIHEPIHNHVPVFSLPRILGTTPETIPSRHAYLAADPVRVDLWHRELSQYSGLKVGIAWQGNPDYAGDRFRSIPLTKFLPLAGLPNVTLLSLQKNFGQEQLQALGPSAPVVDLGQQLDNGPDTFVDTAAVMMNLDVVITSDTAIAHLAGALGVPVWLAVQVVPNWRWMLGRTDSPWYPSLRLFRQTSVGDWDEVFRRIAAELGTIANAVSLPAAPGSPVDVVLRQGHSLYLQGQMDAAKTRFLRVLAIDPLCAEAHGNLGSVSKQQGLLENAKAYYRRALELKPTLAEANVNLGVILEGEQQWDAAAQCYRTAIQNASDFAQAHNNLGAIYRRQDRLRDAIACHTLALRYRPDYPQARYNLAIANLAAGNLIAGWSDYESRFEVPGAYRVALDRPRWNGRPVPGATVLLIAEQGLGDTLQFMRYAPLVRERSGARVLLQCPDALIPLLQNVPGVDQVIDCASVARVPYDVYEPLLSLPGIFATQLETIPASVPYLSADPARVAHWREALGKSSNFKVGIAWQGSKQYLGDELRSIGLLQFAPLADVPGVELFSLQRGHGSEQLGQWGPQLGIRSFGDELDRDGAFLDTAALMMNLDLVVSSDTAVVHLAGALGVPVWVALSNVPDWRWLLARPDSPWYPTMRLFRQPRAGDWPAVFAEIANELALVAQRRRNVVG